MSEPALRQTGQWLKYATRLLEASQIPIANLDALILLEDATGKDRAYLLAHPETVLDSSTIEKLEKQLERRSKHEPLAYIRGKSEFYGREFKVTPATLQPRPETETMIEIFKTLDVREDFHIADIGTGSGAIAITIKLESPKSKVSATEINLEALDIAKQNANLYKTDISLFEGNLLEPLDHIADVILANLPYVPDGHTINEAAMQEPKVAIFGGEDGLDLYRGMFEQLSLYKQKPKFILTESLPFQHDSLTDIAKSSGYKLQTTEDFIQMFAI